MCTSCHSEEVSTLQVGCTAKTRELKQARGAGPVGFALGPEIED